MGLTWRDFRMGHYWKLHNHLSAEIAYWQGIERFLTRYGFAPDDPLMVDVSLTLKHLTRMAEDVRGMISTVAPHRPLVSGWRSSGLSAHLKADFAVRGITDRKS